MDIIGRASRLRLYIGEADKYRGRPLHAALLEMLRSEGYAGATVIRAISGFGHASLMHTASILRLSEDLPIVIDVVDRPERIQELLTRLEEMKINGLATVEDVEVHQYGAHRVSTIPMDARVESMMTRDVTSIRPDAPVSEAVELLYGHLFRALPVVDSERRVVGMLTSGDLVQRAGLPFRMPLLERLGREPSELDMPTADWPVSRVMSRPPIMIRPDARATEAAQLMRKWGVKRLPVVDERGRLVGMLSRWDLISSAARRRAAEEPEPSVSAVPATTVDEVMRPDAPTVRDHAPISDVLDALLGSPIRRVIVVDEVGRAVGIISDADVMVPISEHAHPGVLEAVRARLPGGEAAAEHLRRASARSAEDVMNRDVVVVRSGTSLSDAAQLMVERGRKLLPVVDGEGRPIGVVSRDDVLHAIAQGHL